MHRGPTAQLEQKRKEKKKEIGYRPNNQNNHTGIQTPNRQIPQLAMAMRVTVTGNSDSDTPPDCHTKPQTTSKSISDPSLNTPQSTNTQTTRQPQPQHPQNILPPRPLRQSHPPIPTTHRPSIPIPIPRPGDKHARTTGGRRAGARRGAGTGGLEHIGADDGEG
jgi:hypothetical protein